MTPGNGKDISIEELMEITFRNGMKSFEAALDEDTHAAEQGICMVLGQIYQLSGMIADQGKAFTLLEKYEKLIEEAMFDVGMELLVTVAGNDDDLLPSVPTKN